MYQTELDLNTRMNRFEANQSNLSEINDSRILKKAMLSDLMHETVLKRR